MVTLAAVGAVPLPDHVSHCRDRDRSILSEDFRARANAGHVDARRGLVNHLRRAQVTAAATVFAVTRVGCDYMVRTHCQAGRGAGRGCRIAARSACDAGRAAARNRAPGYVSSQVVRLHLSSAAALYKPVLGGNGRGEGYGLAVGRRIRAETTLVVVVALLMVKLLVCELLTGP